MSDERPSNVEPPPPSSAVPDPQPPGAPAVAWQPPPAASPGARQRSSATAAAAIILLVLGVIGLLIGIAIVATGAVIGQAGDHTFDSVPGFPQAFAGPAVGGFVAIVGALVVVYSLAYIASGIGVLRMRDWGRVLGIVLSIVSGLVWARGLANAGAVLVPGVLLVAHLYVIFALAARWRSA